MTNWDNDPVMSEWDKKYVATNLKPDSKPYSKEFFLKLNQELAEAEEGTQDCSFAIIVHVGAYVESAMLMLGQATVCCAVGRADVVGRLFDDLTENSLPEESQRVFLRLREAIITVLPYLGLPTCIPACYGIIGVVQRKGPEYAAAQRLRKPVIEPEDATRGAELRNRIYTGVGNEEIFSLMRDYFTDFSKFDPV